MVCIKSNLKSYNGLQDEEETVQAAYQSYKSFTPEEQLALWEAYYHQAQGMETSEQTGLGPVHIP